MPVFCQRGFACGETARAVIGPAFWVCRAKSGAAFRCAKPPCAVVRFAAMTSSPRTNVLACPAFASLKRGPSANNPALVAIRLHFAARNRACGYRPHLLGLPRKIARGISLRETTLCGCPLRGHGFATPHRYFAVPVTAAPRRGPNGKTPALVAVRLHFATRNRSVGRCLRRGGNRKPRVGKEESPPLSRG